MTDAQINISPTYPPNPTGTEIYVGNSVVSQTPAGKLQTPTPTPFVPQLTIDKYESKAASKLTSLAQVNPGFAPMALVLDNDIESKLVAKYLDDMRQAGVSGPNSSIAFFTQAFDDTTAVFNGAAQETIAALSITPNPVSKVIAQTLSTFEKGLSKLDKDVDAVNNLPGDTLEEKVSNLVDTLKQDLDSAASVVSPVFDSAVSQIRAVLQNLGGDLQQLSESGHVPEEDTEGTGPANIAGGLLISPVTSLFGSSDDSDQAVSEQIGEDNGNFTDSEGLARSVTIIPSPTGDGSFATDVEESDGGSIISNDELDGSSVGTASSGPDGTGAIDEQTINMPDGTSITNYYDTTGSRAAISKSEVYVASGSTFSLAMGPSETLQLDNPANYAGIIGGFIPGNVIDLLGIGMATEAVLGAGNILSVTGGNTSVSLSLDPGYDYIGSGEGFNVASDGNGGTLVTVQPEIQVPDGQVVTLGQAEAASGATIAFGGTSGVIEIPDIRTFNDTITGFQAGDVIKLLNFNPIFAVITTFDSRQSLGVQYAFLTFTFSIETLFIKLNQYNEYIDIYGDNVILAGFFEISRDGNDYDITTTETLPKAQVGDVFITGPIDNTSQTITGPATSTSLEFAGNSTLSGSFNTGGLTVGTATTAGSVVVGVGSNVVDSSTTVLAGALAVDGVGASLSTTGALTLNYGQGSKSNTLLLSRGGSAQFGSVVLTPFTIPAGGPISAPGIGVDATSTLEVGNAGGAGTGKLTIDPGATISGNGDIYAAGGILDNGTIDAVQDMVLESAVSGTGTILIENNATADLSLTTGPSSVAVNFVGSSGTLVIEPLDSSIGLSEQGTISGFATGDAITYITTNSSVAKPLTSAVYQSVSSGLGTLTLFDGTSMVGTFMLAGDYTGDAFSVTHSNGTGLYSIGVTPVSVPTSPVTVPVVPPVTDIDYTDVTTDVANSVVSTVYSGPVSYLQKQFIWSSPDNVAMAADTPNMFLKGGPGDDALVAKAGSNVLDGGIGSNFLVGAPGNDGGFDTFFIDGRSGGVTWSTITNFHHGDAVTFFGFNEGVSTQPWTALDGAAGYQGATIHSELGGAGTGINASVTFAGISLTDAIAKFTISTGVVGGNPYMYVAYTG